MLQSACLLAAALAAQDVPAELLTVAEASGFEETATHAQVVELCERLDAASELVVAAQLGTSFEGRALPLLILAKPPVADAAEARASGKPIVFAFGNIHAGEVCGKEALLALARELAFEEQALLEDLVVVLAPIYNADGNERMAPDNRPGQVGPRAMGQRANAQGLDLNRDWMKLEAPETRALVRFLCEWDPHLIIDTHTTNGSRHRYTLTYAAPLCPAGDPAQIALVRDALLPAVSASLYARTGIDSFAYGNFDAEHASWSTYSGFPRHGGPYHGLRGQMSILTEAYAYAPFEDRVRATQEFVRETLRWIAGGGRKSLVFAWSDWRRRFAREPDAEERARRLPVRFELASSGRVTVKGFAPGDGAAAPRDWDVAHFDRFAPTREVAVPYAYALPPSLGAAVANLAAHGIELDTLGAARELSVDVYRVRAIERAGEPYQGHALARLEVEPLRTETRTLAAGTAIARTWQPLGNLLVYALEPESEDGLAAWNFLDAELAVGGDYPIVRLGPELDQ